MIFGQRHQIWQVDETTFNQKRVVRRSMTKTQSQSCHGCRAAFSFWSFRHHCHMCGNAFCSTCCTGVELRAGMNRRHAKVCVSCIIKYDESHTPPPVTRPTTNSIEAPKKHTRRRMETSLKRHVQHTPAFKLYSDPWNDPERPRYVAALPIDESRPLLLEMLQLLVASLGCRMAFISFADASSEWIAASVGLDCSHAPWPKSHSITAHMMASHNPLVVDNARADPSFRGHPWVVGLPHMRCFAAAPIINEAGYVLGSVTVLDTQPSNISSVVSSKLQAAAEGVAAALNPDSPLFQMQSERSQARSAMYKLAQNMAESDEVLTTFSNSSSQRTIMIA